MLNLAQAVLNSIQSSLQTYGSMTRWRWMILRGQFGFRRLLLAFYDPAVKHRIGKHEILLPFSHNLPIDDAASPGRFGNLIRIAEHVCSGQGGAPLIDIGANVGDSIAALRNTSHFPILAIEGDETFYHFLKRNAKAFPDVWTVHALLSDHSHLVPGVLEANYGGSKQVSIRPDATQNLKFLTLPDIIQEYPRFNQAKLVKIDTDGYDCKIIRGSVPWLKVARPIIFFEYDPHHLSEQGDDGISIFDDLRKLGYEGVLVFEGNGDFMFSLELSQERLIEELHCYFLGRRSKKYADLCVFHRRDRSLFEECRLIELRNAKSSRSGIH
jgi:FkbM family methyltransferase